MIDNAGKIQVKRPPSPSQTIPPNQSSPNQSSPNQSSPGKSTGQPADSLTNQHTQQLTDSNTKEVNSPQTGPSGPAAPAPNAGSSTNDGSPPRKPLAQDSVATSADPISGVEVTQGFETVAVEEQVTQQSARNPDTETSSEHDDGLKIPKRLGGFKLGKQLGKGGMGTVYLATQLSLDRDVAIKVLKPSLTKNASFVSRFVREAFAAAQLVHHNVVQIYDIGSQDDIHFFSMELVKGESLSGLIRRQRRIDCDTAAGYVLQAARGLKFAHDQGMVHRDVKPGNLMLDEHGIIKVADLGLVKLEDAPLDEEMTQSYTSSRTDNFNPQITQAGVSVGTPTYMAPEQWKRSSTVDQRADIYSLGCTFYVMVTGKLPFDGRTAKEIVTKITSEQAIPPELIVKDIPKKISSILERMIAKDPKNRYPDMGVLISNLEEFLGVSSTGAFSPSERHVEILEKSVNDFNTNRLVGIRKSVLQVAMGLAGFLLLTCFFFERSIFLALAATVASTGISYFLIRGFFEKTHLFSRTRDYLFSNRMWDWITMGITALVAVSLVTLVLGSWVTLLLAGPVLAAGIYFGLDKTLAVKRKTAVAEAEKLFRVLRLRGLNEDLLRQFVCKFSGNQWEEFFEELFGYKAKISARNWLKGESGKRRKMFRWWRDPLIRAINNRFEIRDQARQIRHFEKVEMHKLLAQGVEKADAKIRARHIAKLMTENADAWKQSQSHLAHKSQSAAGAKATVVQTTEQPQPTLSNLSRNLDDRLKNRGPKITLAERFHGSVNFFIGPRARFLVGILLFGLCLWWLQKNGKIESLRQAESISGSLSIVFSDNIGDSPEEKTKPVGFAFLPESVLGLLNNVNHGFVGLIFIISALIPGWLLTIPIAAGGALAILGSNLNLFPEDGFWILSPENLSLISGLVIAVVGGYFCRSRSPTGIE